MQALNMLNRYKPALLSHSRGRPLADELLIEQSGDLAMYYAPFEHVNQNARVVFVGITPGLQQAENAFEKAAMELRNGADDETVLSRAKEFASFSGAMRTNLVSCLDAIGLGQKLGVYSCSEAFNPGSEIAHFTSVLRYPTFLAGANYSGKPDVLRTPFLKNAVDRWFATEVEVLPQAVWIPLGPTPTAVLEDLATRGKISRRQIFSGLPHPSGANAERISYFLGRKERAALSAKTDPVKLDRARSELQRQVASM